MSGKPLLFKWTRSEIVEKRRRIARFLLSESGENEKVVELFNFLVVTCKTPSGNILFQEIINIH